MKLLLVAKAREHPSSVNIAKPEPFPSVQIQLSGIRAALKGSMGGSQLSKGYPGFVSRSLRYSTLLPSICLLACVQGQQGSVSAFKEMLCEDTEPSWQ